MTGWSGNVVWQSIDVERGALADDLAQLDQLQWSTPSLCAGLTVREVLAHLTVSGAVSGPRWFAGVVRSRFDFDKQVGDRLREQLGTSSTETLSRFRSTIGSRTSPPIPRLALLGEMVVHGEDIRRPLGLVRNYPDAVLVALLRYYAGTDQVVIAKKRVRGLRLVAEDAGISLGDGDAVRGSTVALIMAMTGRSAYCAELAGPGVAELVARSS
ncbi:maleylpyruvate isomerase family mycothiol-dependent enzyme [Arthrobacter gandavensis]|uniref:maleylpyruvate isomerase family mycothiol-dependent enzyme n=1 Tax=Arthrobacter gandavensis TaxID=169960 RepID=UPI00188DD84E|nr:maleylpyruvate isomerase family mycothiol-dependent enzyme [Arthrobacter gandavensis]MBF4995305.1 maleylpyruvate isomerase family mycothiol-dependent enzyme [Arthrobacter gandavensis]